MGIIGITGFGVMLRCLSRRLVSRLMGVEPVSFVGEHEPPGAGRDLVFEGSHCCLVGLCLADLAVVLPARAVAHPDLLTTMRCTA